MSAYLTKAQAKKLLDTYKLRNLKRFHSMNAAIGLKESFTYAVDDMTGKVSEPYCLMFYSYYTQCLSWYPQDRMLLVAPIISDKSNYVPSPTTTRQVNRFLKECVSPRLSVAALQYGFDASVAHEHYGEIDDIDVRYVKHNLTLYKGI